MRLFGHAGLRNLFAPHTLGNQPLDDNGEENQDEEEGNTYSRRRRRTKGSSISVPAVPSECGQRLMATGTFGDNEYYEDKLRKRKKRLVRRLMYRELGTQSTTPNRMNKLISQVWPSNDQICEILMSRSSGSNSFFKCRHHHSLRRTMLLWPVLRRWQLLLLVCPRLQGPNV